MFRIGVDREWEFQKGTNIWSENKKKINKFDTEKEENTHMKLILSLT